MRPVSYLDDDYLITEKKYSISSLLLPGETLIGIADISPGIYWKGIVMLLAAALALFYAAAMAIYLAIVAGILLLTAFTTKRYMMLAATDHRVIIGGGVFNQEVVSMPYNRLEGVELMRSPVGMLFGYSSIILSGTGRARIIVPFIGNGVELADDINRRVLERDLRR
ncbi:MAG TPA: PH domain-containing protein [Patescibacteria group bacterium]|nr:PH domain-containing protein [Patescibacteria group bacterium]